MPSTTESCWGEEVPHADDGASAPLRSVYISEAEKYDKSLVETWRADMEGMLIFAGLFSASLTAFLIESSRHGDHRQFITRNHSHRLFRPHHPATAPSRCAVPNPAVGCILESC
ncbi:hypothetical protein FB451DRAFT_1260690 [Mycena latifolia]|nr:hypothetical protein FB451DRAFT_1260690 [Mycena latifolia]